MDSRTLSDRLRGGIAGYFAALGALGLTSIPLELFDLSKGGTNLATHLLSIGLPLISLFAAACLFLKARIAIPLALILITIAIVLCGIELTKQFHHNFSGVFFLPILLSVDLNIGMNVGLIASLLSLRRLESSDTGQKDTKGQTVAPER